MHIETSADARRSRRHAAGGGLAGPAADDRGYLAAAASRLSLWWHGASRPQGLTADTDPGAGLQARDEGEDQPPNGDAIPAPSADGYPRSEPDHHEPRNHWVRDCSHTRDVCGFIQAIGLVCGHEGHKMVAV